MGKYRVAAKDALTPRELRAFALRWAVFGGALAIVLLVGLFIAQR